MPYNVKIELENLMKELNQSVLWNMRFYFRELNFMDNNNIAKEWFEFAKRDLESAKFLMKIMQTMPLVVQKE